MVSVFWVVAANIASHLWKQPLDLGTCLHVGWGCRHLRLDHRLLVEEKPDGEVLYKLRTGDGELKKLLVRVEALLLRNRSFRFADFEASEFYDADLSRVDLTQARLSHSSLQGGNLREAQLQGALLWSAQMQGAYLAYAQMQGADLMDAQMQGTSLWGAQMQGADAQWAQLQGADLRKAQMQGTDLRYARLDKVLLDEKTDLSLADLRETDASGTWPKVQIEAGKPTLATATDHPQFTTFQDRVTSDEKTYDAALGPYLDHLARSDADVARGMARRVVWSRLPWDHEGRTLWPDLARRLLVAEREGAVKLDLSPGDRKTLEDLATKATAPPQ